MYNDSELTNTVASPLDFGLDLSLTSLHIYNKARDFESLPLDPDLGLVEFTIEHSIVLNGSTTLSQVTFNVKLTDMASRTALVYWVSNNRMEVYVLYKQLNSGDTLMAVYDLLQQEDIEYGVAKSIISVSSNMSGVFGLDCYAVINGYAEGNCINLNDNVDAWNQGTVYLAKVVYDDVDVVRLNSYYGGTEDSCSESFDTYARFSSLGLEVLGSSVYSTLGFNLFDSVHMRMLGVSSDMVRIEHWDTGVVEEVPFYADFCKETGIVTPKTVWTLPEGELPATYCTVNPCLNGGTNCSYGWLFQECNCNNTGFVGTACELAIDECESSPCLNNGACEDGIYSFECTCNGTGFFGLTCETEVDDCASTPCQNNGTCADYINLFACNCSTGYEGVLCSEDIDDCASSPCYQGMCTDTGANNFTCTCDAGYEGLLCEHDINECTSSPCLNDGTCTNNIDNFTCECTTGFAGFFCEVDVDDCLSSPCQNDGSCADAGISAFQCSCKSGFEGFYCELDVDDCLSSPCKNNGSCADAGISAFQCSCKSGFEGFYCELDVDDCIPALCQNGAICIDIGVNAFECECPTTHSGHLCETLINTEPTPSVFPPVTIFIEVPAFSIPVNSSTSQQELAKEFVVDLKQNLLPQALGGTPGDYEVTVQEQADSASDSTSSWIVTIVAANPSGRDGVNIEEIIANDPHINERVDGDMKITVVQDEPGSAYPARGTAVMNIAVVVLWSILLLI